MDPEPTGSEPVPTGISDEERKRQRANLAKRSAAGMEKSYQDKNRAALEEAESLNAPPVIVEGKCQTCQSPHRLWIERRLMKGDAYKTIAEMIPDGPDRRSISNHAKKHMPIESAIVRAVLEEEAGLLGQNLEEGVQGAFSMRGALHVLIRKAYEDALNNVTTVEPRDLIQLMKLFNEMDSSSSTRMMEEAKASVSIFMEAINHTLTDMFEKEQADEVSRAIVLEVKRLRQQHELEAQIENNLRQLPHGQ
jgi:hypothetical protein